MPQVERPEALEPLQGRDQGGHTRGADAVVAAEGRAHAVLLPACAVMTAIAVEEGAIAGDCGTRGAEAVAAVARVDVCV